MAFLSAPPLPDFLAANLPFDRRSYRLETGVDAGRSLHFIDHGPQSAPPVLLQHGNPTWCYLWRKVIARLEGFRCLAPDLLGLGLSDRLPKLTDHTLERHIAAIAELVEALDLDDLILVGQDWGGPMVSAVGERHRDRVSGVVLANTAVLVPQRFGGTAFHRFSRAPLLSDLVFRGLGFPQRALHRVQGDPASIRGETARAYRWPLRRLRGRAAPLAMARMVPDSPDHPSVAPMGRGEAWLRAFEGPMTLVWGEKDPILGRALKRHREALPRATVRTCDAGHFLQEEVPELLAEAIREVADAGPTRS